MRENSTQWGRPMSMEPISSNTVNSTGLCQTESVCLGLWPRSLQWFRPKTQQHQGEERSLFSILGSWHTIWNLAPIFILYLNRIIETPIGLCKFESECWTRFPSDKKWSPLIWSKLSHWNSHKGKDRSPWTFWFITHNMKHRTSLSPAVHLISKGEYWQSRRSELSNNKKSKMKPEAMWSLLSILCTWVR